MPDESRTQKLLEEASYQCLIELKELTCIMAAMNHKMDQLLEKSMVIVVSIKVGGIILTKSIMSITMVLELKELKELILPCTKQWYQSNNLVSRNHGWD